MRENASGPEGQWEWYNIDWHITTKAVRDLRQRIYRASQDRDLKKLSSLQTLMLKSRANAALSVRQATQTNKGRETPGVDNLVTTTREEKTELIKLLCSKNPWKFQPVKRVYIPKTDGSKRPLGIPTIADRCLQAMVKNALEPEWEAKFEPLSYGFRPGRDCHDAISRIYRICNAMGKKHWVVDADIQGAFDNISHFHLLKSIAGFPAQNLIKGWLEAGILEKGVFAETTKGTPQGGVISPLLANIALHGMERAMGVTYKTRKDYTQITSKRAVVRYADDFVVFTESVEDAKEAKREMATWLAERGLSLSKDKTRILHVNKGFDFLGFTVRLHKAGQGKLRRYKLLICPSKDGIKRFKERLKQEWRQLVGHPAESAILKLNPILNGWGNYYCRVVSKQTFSKLDAYMLQRIARWSAITHPNKSWIWKVKTYFGNPKKGRQDQWWFGAPRGKHRMTKLSWIPIRRHVLILHGASPDNPDQRQYWDKRNVLNAKYLLIDKHRKLAFIQKGRCLRCGGNLMNEGLHLHHIKPKSKGGSDAYKNLELIHKLCHQQAHTVRGSVQFA